MPQIFRPGAILGLKLVSLGGSSAFVPLGALSAVINVVIACAKALLVAMFFMHLRRASALTRLFAVVAPAVLALLFGLSATDYAGRNPAPAAWSASRK